MSGQHGKITVYACGGTGINIGSYFEKMRGNPIPGFADINVVYVDTSSANLRGKTLTDNIYLVDGKDGSGGWRKENIDDVRMIAPDVLRMHKPGDLNILLSSGSGGSGSVIAPVLASQLLADGQNVLPFMVGSTENAIAIKNTIDTLKSYEGVCRSRKRPLALAYHQNGSGATRSSIDMQVRDDVLRVAGLFSGQNLELDSADLRHFLNYDKVTDFEPKLMAFSIVRNQINPGKAHVVTVATLAKDPDDVKHDTVYPYSKTGYVDPALAEHVKLDEPIHFVVMDGVINAIHADLALKAANVADDSRSRTRTVGSIVGKDDNVQDDGMVV